MSTVQPTEAQVLNALGQSGFLFEQEIASALEEKGFHVETSWPFLDQETKKSREIDLRATKNVLHDVDSSLQVFVELLVECKDSDAPLIFLERQKNTRELAPPDPKEYLFPRRMYKEVLSEKAYREVPAFKRLKLAPSHYYFSETMKATQFAKVVRKGNDWVANHDGIYDALFLPLAKALDARVAKLPRYDNTTQGWRAIWLLFPIVVLRDHLMTLTFSGDQKTLSKKGRVTFVRHMDSETLKGDYMVDFVTHPHLAEYIDNEVLKFAGSVSELGQTSPALLRGFED